MKILHVIPSLDPATGGPPIVACALAATQSVLGCEPEILSYHFPAADTRIETSLKNVPHIERVKLRYLPPLTKAERYLARGAHRWLQQSLDPFDLIHLHGIWDPLVRAAGVHAIRKRKPFVLTPHGSLDPWALSQKPVRKRIALLLSYRHMLNEAAFLHFLTDAERERSAPLQLKPSSVILPNGIFLEQLEPLPPRGDFRSAHPEFADVPLVLFLGRLHYKKGLDVLADAFVEVSRQFPDAHLIVAGPDYGAQAAFEAQIARLGLHPCVHLIGPVYGNQKITLLRDADCFVLPSRQEGFSLAIIEAMACATPVVITPGCHFPLVKDVGAGAIAELEPAAIAAALAGLLRDRPLAQKMGQTARDLVVAQFTWTRVATDMVENYRKALAK